MLQQITTFHQNHQLYWDPHHQYHPLPTHLGFATIAILHGYQSTQSNFDEIV